MERKEKQSAQQDLKELRTRISQLEADISKSQATVESYQRQVKDTEVSTSLVLPISRCARNSVLYSVSPDNCC